MRRTPCLEFAWLFLCVRKTVTTQFGNKKPCLRRLQTVSIAPWVDVVNKGNSSPEPHACGTVKDTVVLAAAAVVVARAWSAVRSARVRRADFALGVIPRCLVMCFEAQHATATLGATEVCAYLTSWFLRCNVRRDTSLAPRTRFIARLQRCCVGSIFF